MPAATLMRQLSRFRTYPSFSQTEESTEPIDLYYVFLNPESESEICASYLRHLPIHVEVIFVPNQNDRHTRITDHVDKLLIYDLDHLNKKCMSDSTGFQGQL